MIRRLAGAPAESSDGSQHALNPGRIVTGDPPLTIDVVAKSPVSTALVAGSVVVLKMSCPSKDNPSESSVKYPLDDKRVPTALK